MRGKRERAWLADCAMPSPRYNLNIVMKMNLQFQPLQIQLIGRQAGEIHVV